VRGTYIHPLTGKSSRGGQRRGTKWVAGIEAGLWQLVPAVVESIIINPPLGSPVPRPKQSRMFVGEMV
jgi:hypothetical protein